MIDILIIMQMKQPDTPQMPVPEVAKLTQQDLEDREDFQYLLSIMEKQRAVGITQPLDYVDAMKYRDELEAFKKREAPEGSIVELYDDIIFDFDGVLYDSTYPAYRTTELLLETVGDKNIPIPETVEDLANSFQAPFKDYYNRFRVKLDTVEQIHSLREAYMRIYKQVNAEHHKPAEMYPEVKDVLDKIKEAKKNKPNLKVHIISAGLEPHIKDALIEADILGDFDEIHSDCHDKTEMIQAIRDKFGHPERTIMIGDLPSDIKDGQLVDGVKTIAVARGEVERDRLSMYLPDYVVMDLNGLFDLKSLSKELREKQ
ncbi:TPA: hypothetical protein DEP94_01770 [Candidatus Nomurabacteria bacterium]|nr:hypothetical protein [Candidatus Nomurabacteria bacterium]